MLQHGIASLSILFLAGAHSAPAFAEPYSLSNTDVFDIGTEAANTYRVLVGQPIGEPPDDGYPVLFLLDGDDHFASAVSTARRLQKFGLSTGVGPGLIIGIAYPEASRRSLDYTPGTDISIDTFGNPVGGAKAFRAFLKEHLIPEISGRYPVDPSRFTLFGHSYGGLFTLDTLLTEPSLFSGYVAASPSIWFDERIVLEGLDTFEPVSPVSVLLTAGTLEQPEPKPTDSTKQKLLISRRLVDEVIDFSDALATRPKVTTDTRILEGEDHGTTPLSTLAHAIYLAFKSRSE